MSSDLNKRHQQILSAAIRQYIATAEPVGSKTLVDGYNLNVSPATIRSGFNTLEKAGLLYQPHTSAGRIPSDSGYRLYVDRLMQPSSNIGRKVEELFHDKLDWDRWSLETVLQGAAEVLATLSGYITMITLPQTHNSKIEHIQFVQIESTKIMLIVVLDSYQTQSILMQLPAGRSQSINDDLLERELQVLANFLNRKLRGRSLLDVTTLDWSDLDLEFQDYVNLISSLFTNLYQKSRPIHSPQITIRGIAEILRQPEFSELNQIKTLLHLLESEQEQIWQLIFDPHRLSLDKSLDLQPKIRIRIGTENPIESMQTCTLISATYQQDSIPVGSVSLLGPKRMLYENAIALVQSAADYISEAIAHE